MYPRKPFTPALNVIYEEQEQTWRPTRPTRLTRLILYEQAIIAQFSYWAM